MGNTVPGTQNYPRVSTEDGLSPEFDAFPLGPPGRGIITRTIIPDNEFAEEVVLCTMHHIENRLDGPGDYQPWSELSSRGYRVQQVGEGVASFSSDTQPHVRFRFFPNQRIIDRNLHFLTSTLNVYLAIYFAGFGEVLTYDRFRNRCNRMTRLFLNQISRRLRVRPHRAINHEFVLSLMYAYCVTVVYHTYRVQFPDEEDGVMVYADGPQRIAMAQTEVVKFLQELRKDLRLPEDTVIRYGEWQGSLLPNIDKFMPTALCRHYLERALQMYYV